MNTKSKVTHTPGPWKVGANNWIVAGDGSIPIAKVGQANALPGEQEANASLIAQAPTLFKELFKERNMFLHTIASSKFLIGVDCKCEVEGDLCSLHAAAPELLEALKALVLAVSPDCNIDAQESYFQKPLKRAINIIGKAERKA